ncbi:MAG: nucleotide pyrophosphohydrolase [Candidatus Hodarchaeales archaeon]|jgi:NTP pyrophosphatase (non-canonical NTP hydrolase)
MTKTTISELSELVADFIGRRDWNKYHTPKNLAMSISIEATEIMELFQWVTVEEASEKVRNDSSLKMALEEELADVLIYLLSMANTCHIDLAEVVRSKLKVNEKRFPIEIVSGKLGPYKTDKNEFSE